MAKQKTLSIRTIVAIGIGSALFVILGRFGSIPSGIPDTKASRYRMTKTFNWTQWPQD